MSWRQVSRRYEHWAVSTVLSRKKASRWDKQKDSKQEESDHEDTQESDQVSRELGRD